MRKFFLALGWVWAAPVSMVGLLVAWLWGIRVEIREPGELACLGFATGPFPGPWRPYVGLTLGWVVLLTPNASESTLAHELVHVRQCLWLGPLVILAYPLASLWAVIRGRHWYTGNFFEEQAREKSGQTKKQEKLEDQDDG